MLGSRGNESGISVTRDAGVKILFSIAVLLSDSDGWAEPALLREVIAAVFPPEKKPMTNKTKLFRNPANMNMC